MPEFDRFLIAPQSTGLERDVESWLLPEDAYSTLEDAYLFRGRLKKRFGYRMLGDPGAVAPLRS